MKQKNAIIEHLYKTNVIDQNMKEAIYRYYDYLDLTEELHQKTPDIIYI